MTSGAHANICSVRWSNLTTEAEETARLPGYRDDAVVRHFEAPGAIKTRFYEVRAKTILNRVPEASQVSTVTVDGMRLPVGDKIVADPVQPMKFSVE